MKQHPGGLSAQITPVDDHDFFQRVLQQELVKKWSRFGICRKWLTSLFTVLDLSQGGVDMWCIRKSIRISCLSCNCRNMKVLLICSANLITAAYVKFTVDGANFSPTADSGNTILLNGRFYNATSSDELNFHFYSQAIFTQ